MREPAFRQRNLAVAADTSTHVLTAETELDYEGCSAPDLRGCRACPDVRASVAVTFAIS